MKALHVKPWSFIKPMTSPGKGRQGNSWLMSVSLHWSRTGSAFKAESGCCSSWFTRGPERRWAQSRSEQVPTGTEWISMAHRRSRACLRDLWSFLSLSEVAPPNIHLRRCSAFHRTHLCSAPWSRSLQSAELSLYSPLLLCLHAACLLTFGKIPQLESSLPLDKAFVLNFLLPKNNKSDDVIPIFGWLGQVFIQSVSHFRSTHLPPAKSSVIL